MSDRAGFAVNPLDHFRAWLGEAQEASPPSSARTFCLSTVDESGAPDARFVDLKDVTEAGISFGTHTQSRKAIEMAADPRVAATFWWSHIRRQVRITGRARRLSEAESDAMFRQRPKDAQLVSLISVQSSPIGDPDELARLLQIARVRNGEAELERPDAWSGYCIVPERFEFLTFHESRLHRRQVYSREGREWRTGWLQP